MTGFNKKKEHSNHKRICGVYIHVYSTQLCQQQDTIHDTFKTFKMPSKCLRIMLTTFGRLGVQAVVVMSLVSLFRCQDFPIAALR